MVVEKKILIEKKDHVTTIILNNPEKRNAINKEMFDAIKSIFAELNNDKETWVVVIKGSESKGNKIFTSGIDYFELASNSEKTIFELDKMGKDLQESFNAVERVNKPVIALMEGYCLGAGLELVLACDIRIATNTCLIGFPETELGIIPDLGGTTRMVRTIGVGQTKRMILTADKITGKEAKEIGLIDYLVTPDFAEQKLNEIVTSLLKRSPLALSRGKQLINEVYHLDIESALKVERMTQLELMQAEDTREAFISRMEKRNPIWKNK